MLYFLAFTCILIYSALKWALTEASGYVLTGLGLYFIYTRTLPQIASILLPGGILIIILGKFKQSKRVAVENNKDVITRGGGL